MLLIFISLGLGNKFDVFEIFVGHEAPRNSLEYTIQSSHSYDAIQEDIPVSTLFLYNL